MLVESTPATARLLFARTVAVGTEPVPRCGRPRRFQWLIAQPAQLIIARHTRPLRRDVAGDNATWLVDAARPMPVSSAA